METVVPTKYVEWIRVAHFGMEPALAEREWSFEFESYSLAIALPKIPAKDEDDDYAKAVVRSWYTKTDEIYRVDVRAVRVSILNLSHSIPTSAANHPAIDMRLYDEEQRKRLDSESDRLHHRARRAFGYWLRVVRWKARYVHIDIDDAWGVRYVMGGHLINCESGNFLYAPPVFRTFEPRHTHRLTESEFNAIDAALCSQEEPPVWEEFHSSARRRVVDGDFVAATLDLAIAVESKLRWFLDAALPSSISIGARNEISRTEMKVIFRKWADFGLPTSNGQEDIDLGLVENLFDVRNTLMHRGSGPGITRGQCKKWAKEVKALLAALGP
jgi:hypothetical protein